MESTCPLRRFYLVYPHLLPLVTTFLSVLIKAHNKNIHSKFLRECMEEQVIPRSLLPRRLAAMKDKPFGDLQRVVLKYHLKATREETRECFKQLRFHRYQFQQFVPFNWKQYLYDFCYNKLRNSSQQLKVKLDSKLRVLIRESDWTKHANRDFVINLSSKVLNNDTVAALGYGLNFALNNQINPVAVANGFVNLEKYSNVAAQDINICKGLVYSAMHANNTPTCPRRFLVSYNKLKKDKDIHITKADKSNALVILDKDDYERKLSLLLEDPITYRPLNKDPTDTVNSNFNKTIKQVLKGSPELVKRFTTTTPALPYMYGLIKTHKVNNPVRPIISTVGSASYNLSKWLVTLLSPLIGTISSSNIKNNVDLVHKLNTINITYDFSLISFDVTSLFTRVPVNDLLDFLRGELPKHNFSIPAAKIIELIKLCIIDTKFQCGGKYYKQIFGMGMGNPLSPVLSNIFMEFFEITFLPRVKMPHIHWFRYVDDILCLWPIADNVDIFLQNLNELVPSIQFTIEKEQDFSLPFLDVHIFRHGRNLKYSVYRKPTNICSYVHYYSAHTQETKLAVFSSMFLRCLRVCSEEFVEREKQNIFNIGRKLKYPKIILEKAQSLARKTYFNERNRQVVTLENSLILPYHSNFETLRPLLKNMFNINVIFKNSNVVKNMLIKNSPDSDVGCVYKIPCNACNKIYIGQTGKSLQTRLKQHKYSVRCAQESSAVFLHVRDHAHPIAYDNSTIYKRSGDYQQRNLIESSLIQYCRQSTFNTSVGLYALDAYIVKRICDFIIPS